MTTGGDEARFEPHAFAVEFERFLSEFRRLLPSDTNTLRARVFDHLGVEPGRLPSLAQRLDSSDHPNLQLALDDMAGGQWELIGLSGELRHYHGFSLVGVLAGRSYGPTVSVAPVEYVAVPVSADETHPCVQVGLYLARFEGAPLVVLVFLNEQMPASSLVVEVVTPDRDVAGRFLARLRQRMDDLNVYRGKVLSFGTNAHGRLGINFHQLPAVTRDDVVLPEADIAALERHTLGIAERATALRDAGRHVKRGILLYGPPGTGKTLSVMYLCNLMPDRTSLIMSGIAAGALGQACAIARSLQPSMVVLEDVDLIAMERTMPGATTNPLLFQLLNEMDGLAADADVVFVLTTNRPELLEPALATRPGRIDEVVEVKLPDAQLRRRLFELYLRGVEHRLDNLDNVVSATEGVSAAFIKEVIRRAFVYATAPGDTSAPCLLDEHLNQALAEILSRSDPLTRAVLGAARPGE